MSNLTSATDADLIRRAEAHPIVIEGEQQVALARLMTLKQAVRLEATGMRHSSGKSMRKIAAQELGMARNASFDDVIGRLAKEIDKRLKRDTQSQLEQLRASTRKPPHRVEE